MTSGWVTCLHPTITNKKPKTKFRPQIGLFQRMTVSKARMFVILVLVSTVTLYSQMLVQSTQREWSLLLIHSSVELSQGQACTIQRNHRQPCTIACGRSLQTLLIRRLRGLALTCLTCTLMVKISIIRPLQVPKSAEICASQIISCIRVLTRNRIRATITCTILQAMILWECLSSVLARICVIAIIVELTRDLRVIISKQE